MHHDMAQLGFFSLRLEEVDDDVERVDAIAGGLLGVGDLVGTGDLEGNGDLEGVLEPVVGVSMGNSTGVGGMGEAIGEDMKGVPALLCAVLFGVPGLGDSKRDRAELLPTRP